MDDREEWTRAEARWDAEAEALAQALGALSNLANGDEDTESRRRARHVMAYYLDAVIEDERS